jgi:hypothetical protein
MQKSGGVQKSKILYEKAKSYFLGLNLPDCIIEISDKPLSEWIIHLTPTDEEVFILRNDLCDKEKPFISLYVADDKNHHFFFGDESLIQIEVVETGEILDFHDRTVDCFNREILLKEIAELKKMLQAG